ncbi:MAG: ATP-binding cassette domain-containing protein, partial [Thermobifida sp.]|nr:ATP-binding cassette domain-containing protein [Thermobifida sp.]
YAGRIVETAPTKTLFTEPKHRYTSSLMAALPERALAAGTKLFSIPGAPPSLTNLPKGCRFAARCLWATDECRAGYPDLNGDENHTFSCFHPVQEGDESPAVLQAMMDSGKAENAVDSTGQISHEVLLDVKEASRVYESAGSGFFKRDKGVVSAVDRVSITVNKGETYGLVGESGCGKSITALTIMGLIDPKAEITGEILYQGENLLEKSAEERRALLGHEMAMIYQDALSSLNPAMLIRDQMKQLTRRGGTRSAEELLWLVGLDPKRTLESYPHELSGGQRQRVLIAMALTRDPKLIIADEPTTALDVTVQKQVIALLNELREKLGFAMIFVSHDLALVAEVAHHITVMYAGQVIEQAPTKELLMHPTHEYTRGLLGAVLSIESGSGRLHQVPGTVPSPRDFPVGDRFAPRSSHPDYGLDIRPVLTEVGPEHVYAALPPRDEAQASAQETNGQEETR